MRPAFLTRPELWTRTPRTGQSAIDKACAVEIREAKQARFDWVLLILFVATVVAITLGAL
jgi:hypothetical protein